MVPTPRTSPGSSSRGQPDQANTPLAPVITGLERTLRSAPDAPGEGAAELRALSSASGLADDAAALIASLLDRAAGPADDESPDTRWARTIEALVRWVRAMAAAGPLVIQVEDAHWLDPSTLQLLAQLVEDTTSEPVLIVVTTRPELAPAWSARPHVRTVALQRLSAAESAQLIAGHSGAEPLARQQIAAIAARGEGVPLYLEELAWLARTVPEASLVGDIPDTLQHVLRARLDRLGAERALVAVAAVLGNDVEPDLLADVAGMSTTTVDEQLDSLVRSDVLVRQSSPHGPSYVFRHALLRDAAYSSLVRTRRVAVHQRAATALAVRFPERATRRPEQLAHHYTRAGMPVEAVRAWRDAARSASARNALTEAAGAYERALELVATLRDDDGRERLELTILLGMSSVLHNGVGAGDERFRTAAERALALARVEANHASLFMALTMAAAHHSAVPDRARAEPLLREILELTPEHGRLRMAALSTLGTNAVLWGERHEALQLLDECRSMHDPSHVPNDYDAGAAALVHRAIVLRELGRLDEAMAARREAEAIVATARPFNRCLTEVQLATMAALRGDVDGAARSLDSASRLAERHRFANLEVRISILGAAVDALAGGSVPRDVDDALDLARQRRNMASMSPYLLLLAEAWAAASDPPRALAVADDALALVAASGEEEYTGELHRVRGEQLLAVGDAWGAVDALRTAVDVATRDGAVLFGAKAAAAWRTVDREAGEQALREFLPGLVLGTGAPFEPDVDVLRSLIESVAGAATD